MRRRRRSRDAAGCDDDKIAILFRLGSFALVGTCVLEVECDKGVVEWVGESDETPEEADQGGVPCHTRSGEESEEVVRVEFGE